mgnify:CR=1 FL=1
MWPVNPFSHLWLGELFETLMPDFVLAFTFFTALTFAVLGRRLQHRRSAAAMSAAMGMALAVGLVYWEYRTGWSIRSLGTIAVGLALIALALVIYQAFKQIGGAWVGGSLAFAAALLIGMVLELPWPVGPAVMQILIIGSLIAAAVGFLMRRTSHHDHGAGMSWPTDGMAHASPSLGLRQDTQRLEQLERNSRALERQLQGLQQSQPGDSARPDAPVAVRQTLQRLLPESGWLTEQLAGLRAKAHRARVGEIARIHEMDRHWRQLSPKARKVAAEQIKSAMKRIRAEQRLERLDRAVAEAEKRIAKLIAQANDALGHGDYQRVANLIGDARKLQHHVSELMTAIQRSEHKLDRELHRVLSEAPTMPVDTASTPNDGEVVTR